jgi:hypothetical protein
MKNPSRFTTLAFSVFVFLAFAGVVTVNALANILPLNGVNTGVLSDEIPNLFVPAGLTFAVWGLIYLLLTVLVVCVFFIGITGKFASAWTPVDSLLFIVNALANISWIFAWHWRLVPLSLAIMLVLLGTLIALSERISLKKMPGNSLSSDSGEKTPAILRFGLSVPLHVYLGWICVATIANVTALLVTIGWDGFGLDPRIWTVLVILAGLAVALLLAIRRNMAAAPLVVVWAYAGIVIKRISLGEINDPAVWLSAVLSASVILVVLAVRALIAVRKK